ncbi:MAG: hypothetical protein EBR40_11890, partial [Proteobacteria bacterium]|nr:hypothetical protein [Pseudomonadota bacterium]
YGGSGLAGLNPDIRAKVARMMRANPRLRMTSGLRDGYTSAKLKRKGIGNFGSGTPFMGDVGSPNRHSPHSAGWAADLGPRSEYGWLRRNAHKFGLETASGFGEPWHVQNAGTLSGFGGPMGKGKIGDLGDPGGDVGFPGFGDILELIDLVRGIADTVGFIGRIIKAVFGAFDNIGGLMKGGFLDTTGAGPDKVQSKAAGYLTMMGLGPTSGGAADTVIPYDPKYASSLPTSLSLDDNAWRGQKTVTSSGVLMPGSDGGSFFGGAGSGSVQQILQKYAGNNSVEAKSADAATAAKILATLKVAAATGLSGDELIAAVSIAGRESNFNPNVHNPNRSTGDDSYGLWQINLLGSMGASRRKALGLAADGSQDSKLMDPALNARAMAAVCSNVGLSGGDLSLLPKTASRKIGS